MAKRTREAGLLLHPTSLPGPNGCGELGPEAHAFVDALQRAGCTLWQLLPLGPTSYGNSPYASYSTFAGNPLLISIPTLLEEKWLAPKDVTPCPPGATPYRVDFDTVAAWKLPTLRACYHRFQKQSTREEQSWFLAFCHAHQGWLEDYAFFMALKEDQGDLPWTEWETPLRRRQEKALKQKRQDLLDEIEYQKFIQFLFDRQWEGLHNHCAESGIRLVGDVPIFVALDSADVWTHQELFFLDAEGLPTAVAGVPPDYFSTTGQLWGNPLYRWPAHKETNYAWWLERLAVIFQRVDVVRIDHFRGFEAYWEVPAGDKTAENGRWVKGPGAHFLTMVQERFGGLPLIAEDLGIITPEVDALRERFALPGMRVLQFAFTGEDPRVATHAPHNHQPDTVVYTGTHDNDTTVGWFHGQDEDVDLRPPGQRALERENFLAYVGARDTDDVHWRMTALALSSVARSTVIPVQDILGLGSDARMNRPGLLRADNWSWRLSPEQFETLCSAAVTDRLRDLIYRYGRLPEAD